MSSQRHQEKSAPAWERERPPALWLFFLCFLLPMGLPSVNWARQECCLSYLMSYFRSSDLPLSYFEGFSLPCLSATAILDSCFLFELPNTAVLSSVARPLLLLPPIFSSIRGFSNESALGIKWPKYWSFSFSFRPFS